MMKMNYCSRESLGRVEELVNDTDALIIIHHGQQLGFTIVYIAMH